ncbi:aminotransferase class V-fold PLP-dependent enzyme [Aureivirga sp. CE67]|uniref:aminotransferase class V-fold PLP-dependent enzyme n=1 Tax=Aureivirga sp. CE67 TaxID=1788983 RepID=UPI0018CAFFC5|nr:aminotransferase class V-fold PLP-dependent enzyme [Aureivirga sp. CE67]
MKSLEQYFTKFRDQIVGIDHTFSSPYGEKNIIYTDWTASGRLYKEIEEKMLNDFGPFVANTHTETSITGSLMTMAYHEAREIIKRHVNANANDALITSGTGMTGVVNKFQRILGLRIPEQFKDFTKIPDEIRPVIFISHMEHHSNQTTWLETISDVEIIPCDEKGLICLDRLEEVLEKHKDRKNKIASITACSNVTGIKTDYHGVAKVMHKHGGLCFVDFACSAPYVKIDMHPDDESYLDAIFFSPHKFLGGPGTSGVLIFNKELYTNNVPDCPGGGTVTFTNPWGDHDYFDDIETREDGGTPGFLQTIRIALSVQLKDEMGTENIAKREDEINAYVFNELEQIPNLHILAGHIKERLGIFSFYIDDLHFNLAVKLLNDRYGIQTRGGCSCAGTYGHFLLHVDAPTSAAIVDQINQGCLIEKPGWVRMSIHPTTTDAEIQYVCKAIKELAENFKEWAKDYEYDPSHNEFKHKEGNNYEKQQVLDWFSK